MLERDSYYIPYYIYLVCILKQARKLDVYFEYEEKIMSKTTVDKSLLDVISDPDGMCRKPRVLTGMNLVFPSRQNLSRITVLVSNCCINYKNYFMLKIFQHSSS